MVESEKSAVGREARIRTALTQVLQPSSLQVEDESTLHIGHPGAAGGGSHFAVAIVAECFRDKSPVERHRMVYQALGEMMRGEVHALRINARGPDELEE